MALPVYQLASNGSGIGNRTPSNGTRYTESQYQSWLRGGTAPAAEAGQQLTGWGYMPASTPDVSEGSGYMPGVSRGASQAYYTPIWGAAAAPAPAPVAAPEQQAPAPAVAQGPTAAEVAAQQAAANAAAQQSAESSRLQGLYGQADAIAKQLAGSMGGLTTKTGYGIESAQSQRQQAENILAQILGSSAVTGGQYDATGANLLKSQLGGFGSTLGTLQSQREKELADLITGAQGKMTQASGLMDWDEKGLQEALNGIVGARDTLGTYQGSDMGDLLAALNSMYGGVNSRLGSLSEKRTGLEGSAADLYAKLKGETFRKVGELSPYQQQLESLKTDLDKWGASQATDEYQAIADMLGLNRTRLEGEAETIASEQAKAQQRYRQMQSDIATRAIPQPISAGGGYSGTNLAALQNAGIDVSGYDTTALLRALGLA